MPLLPRPRHHPLDPHTHPPTKARSDRHEHTPHPPTHPCSPRGCPPRKVTTIPAHTANPNTDPAARRSLLARAERLRGLTDTEQDLIRLANDPGFSRWIEQIRSIGGCAHPIYLTGRTTTYDGATGEVLRHYDTAHEPGGRMPVRCRNHRTSRCAPCAWEHQGDTFHLIRSGLTGGKGIPETVRDHPRLFVTLTAPSFGHVHRATQDGERCRPRREGGLCAHGQPVGCNARHGEGDPGVGQPLCAACYDYPGHVLWQAHTRELWDRFTRNVRRHLATAHGITQTALAEHLRVSFAKVAEYQKRGAIHFHAVIRLDGPDGPDTAPPDWATAELLAAVVRSAAGAVLVRTAHVSALGEVELRWGAQLDIRPLRAFDGDERLSDDAVAAYVAKYTTKSIGDAGGVDRRIDHASEIAHLPVNTHVRALIATCWRLGGLPELEHLRLRTWAHMLGYRGHCLTKSRRYSTTYGALRQARAEYQRARVAGALFTDWDNGTETESAWRYIGSAHTPGEAEIAAGIAEDLARSREIAREERAADGGRWSDVASA